MPPRRKKVVGSAGDPERSEAESKDPSVTSQPKPKKKRAPRAKKPAVSASTPVFPPMPVPSPQRPAPAGAGQRIPAIIPIKAAPPAQRITIEPDIRVGEVEDAWTPSSRKDVDLSVPPKPLLQSRKTPKTDLEEFLADEAEEEGRDRSVFRPPVRTSAYRRIALGFAVLALLVGAGVMYVVYAHAAVIVYPQKTEVKTERALTVDAAPAGPDEIPGAVSEVTVAGEKTEAPASSTKTDGVAAGKVTLINDSTKNQALVATTRLLAPDGTLFRLKSSASVPAHGRVTADVYADKAGEGGNISPTTFTIPGLNASQQKVIYAKSDAPMTGGVVTVGAVTSADIDKTEADLRRDLVAQAQAELDKSAKGAWTGQAMLAETMSRSVSAGPGETANGITVRLTLRVREVDFDRSKAIAAAAEDLKRSLTTDRELTGVKADNASYSVDQADPKAGTASLRVALTGESQVSLQSPLFDAGKLRGLDLKGVQAYFEGIEGVERVEVIFRPFWLKRMPLLPDRIDFEIQK